MPCESHSAAVVDRDGAVVCRLDELTSVEWARLLDQTAAATVTAVPSGDCCACVGRVRTWRHRLVVWNGRTLVFDGPIKYAVWGIEGIELRAEDHSTLLERRLPHSSMSFVRTDLAAVAQTLVEDALLPDDPGVTIRIVSPTLIFGDRAYAQDVGLVIDHLQDLSETGLDWTMAGSSLLLFGEDFDGVVGSLSDSDFPDGLLVIEDGGSTYGRLVMHYGDGDSSVSVGGVDDYYGLLEGVADAAAPQDLGAASVFDASSASAALTRQLRASNPSPVSIDTGRGPLDPSADVDLGTLIPGYCLEVSSTASCRSVTAVQKIYEVRVTEGDSGQQVRVLTAPLRVSDES